MSDVIHLLKFGVTACLLPGTPKDWPENHKWVGEEDKNLVTCPTCIKGMQFGDPTFQLLDNATKIKCRRCGFVSSHRDDIENHYCGRCHVSHDDIWPPGRKAWIDSYAIPS
jgi:ribosomal protein L37E